MIDEIYTDILYELRQCHPSQMVGQVDLLGIINRIPDLKIIPYTKFVSDGTYSSIEELLHSVSSRDGFISAKGSKFIIFYNDTMPITRMRFTLAHELSHYLLGHVDEDPDSETEANRLASLILCDMYETMKLGDLCIRYGYDYEIMISDYFDVSREVAEIRVSTIAHDIITYSFGFELDSEESKIRDLSLYTFEKRKALTSYNFSKQKAIMA